MSVRVTVTVQHILSSATRLRLTIGLLATSYGFTGGLDGNGDGTGLETWGQTVRYR